MTKEATIKRLRESVRNWRLMANCYERQRNAAEDALERARKRTRKLQTKRSRS